MTTKALILPLDHGDLPRSAGNKALNLRRLFAMGLRTPTAYAVLWDAYQRYTQDDISLVSDLRVALSHYLDPGTAYAVRSSANIEDMFGRSFAGQFKSVLNTRGIDGVFQAIWAVWGTAQSLRVQSYLEQHGLHSQDLFMGVIIQEMVPPVFAGVALSRNPVTGADEVVVEAVKGSGEALVQSGVTPNRWINKWGTWIAKPQKSDIPLKLIEEVVAETRRIAKEVDSFVDLEWVYDGTNLYWLQVREIMAVYQHNVYSNHISKEMVPGMIKPLIGSINIPMICSKWVRLLKEMLGFTRVHPEDLAKLFYYRMYFNMGTLGQIFQDVGIPADSVETLMGVLPENAKKPAMKPTFKTILHLPWIVKFLVKKWFFSKEMHKALPKIERDFKEFNYQHASMLTVVDLYQEIDRLYDLVAEAAYYNVLGPLLLMMYTRVFKNQLSQMGIEFSKFDLMEGVPELLSYDPNHYLHDLHDEFCLLDEATQTVIRNRSYEDFTQLPGIPGLQKKVNAFLERFGHLSAKGNDFSFPPWRETPGMVLDMIINFEPSKEGKQKKIKFEDLNLRGMKRRLVGLFYHRVRDFHLMREQIGSYYAYGYGLFRYYYLAIGAHLVRKKIIEVPSDVFYLEDAEIRQLLGDEPPGFDARQVVAQHKVDIERFKDITLPSVIYGDETPPVTDPSLEKLVGVPTSIGHYTGKVAVVRGIQDFNKVQQGDVLVIPYSEVSWTPLFARAGGVVAESGGLLSHSSIVAREYGIPAVVSVDGAMGLRDGMQVTVNGHTGEVILHGDEETILTVGEQEV
jgi:pyruvate,water dikinase